ncbi:cytochrome ubiquinol oxidase subunit I [Methylomonas sp. HYX-M1]|uniref:cytochrome ubiquinol oxidase subunit I n=1 Tax=Methylomonas sp. HYX-M1 TaxID=3139307 RepID=UPI00345C1BC2
MLADTVIELSRWQFAVTALLHFLFIPFTLVLALLLAVTETLAVFSDASAYQRTLRFWRHIFAINFLLALATRLWVLCEFGMNGSYFSHYVGDIVALPLAIEAFTGLAAGVALFVPYCFAYHKLSKFQRCSAICLLALAVHSSAYWVLVANAWLQQPIAAAFDYQSYRMVLQDGLGMLFNPAAADTFIHVLAASYLAAVAVILAVSARQLRQDPQDSAARYMFKLAAPFGLVAVAVLLWQNGSSPDGANLVQRAKYSVLQQAADATLLTDFQARIRSGMETYNLLQQLRDSDNDKQLLSDFNGRQQDLGYAWLLSSWHKPIVGASAGQIESAAQSALPAYRLLFYGSYYSMIAVAWLSAVLMLAAVWKAFAGAGLPAWLITCCCYGWSLPWLASISGWFFAQGGLQPWVVAGVLPIRLAVSSLSVSQLAVSSGGFVLLCVILLMAGRYGLQQANRQAATERSV